MSQIFSGQIQLPKPRIQLPPPLTEEEVQTATNTLFELLPEASFFTNPARMPLLQGYWVGVTIDVARCSCLWGYDYRTLESYNSVFIVHCPLHPDPREANPHVHWTKRDWGGRKYHGHPDLKPEKVRERIAQHIRIFDSLLTEIRGNSCTHINAP